MIEILMITHNRLEYLKKALPALLTQTRSDYKVFIWDNGSDQPVIDYLKLLDDPRVELYFNQINSNLSLVTTDVFLRSDAEFVGKVDADTIVLPDWLDRLVSAHERYHFGFIGGFHFRQEDLDTIKPIITDFNGVKIWQKHHIGGCSFVIRRADFKGYKGQGVMGLSEYQAEMGLPNGYLWDPILWVEHMEDARSEHYINSKEYEDYKLKTRGVSLAQYQGSISNQAYLQENTHG